MSTFHKKKFGLMVHYLYGLQNGRSPWNMNKVTSWDSCVNDFDAQKFASDVEATGAGYVIFTLYQGDQYICAPNITFEKLSGIKRGKATATRDLIADIYTELNKKNIDLLLYATGNGPINNYGVMANLTNNNFHERVVNNAYQVDKPFVNNWGKVLEDFSMRYQTKIKGWWIDGAYSFIGYNDATLAILSASLKAGNKNAIVAFNPGPLEKISYYSKYDDYTAGEIYHIHSVPSAQYINGVQWHAVTFLGSDWGMNNIRFTKLELANYLKACFKYDGVVTLDIFLRRDGSLDNQQKKFLKEISIII